MKTTDTSEKGLESIIVASLIGESGYVQGDAKDYDREHAIDLAKLLQFLVATQPDTFENIGIDEEGPKRTQFLHRLQEEIAKRGVVDVLRGGIKHGPSHVDLFYPGLDAAGWALQGKPLILKTPMLTGTLLAVYLLRHLSASCHNAPEFRVQAPITSHCMGCLWKFRKGDVDGWVKDGGVADKSDKPDIEQ